MKVQIETNVYAGIIADPHAKNKGTTAGVRTSSVNLGTSGSAVTVTSANIIETLAKCGQVMDEQDVPLEGRYFLMPPQMYYGAFLVSNLANASYANAANTSQTLTGKVTNAPSVAGFNIYVSNLVPISSDSGNKFNCLFGQQSALTFAMQITKSETVQLPNPFAHAFWQLAVFGYKTVKSEALVNLYCAVA